MSRGAAGQRVRALALPALSGVLLAAAAPPALAPVLPFVALVPLALWTARLPGGGRMGAGSGGPLAAAAGGMVVGALQHAWGLRWLPGTLGAVAGGIVGWAAFAAVVAVLAAATGAATCALHALLNGRRPLPVALALPVTWTALEWALAHLPFGWAFPWAPLGLGLARWPVTLALAEVVGVSGVTAWLATVSGLAGEAVLRSRVPEGSRRALGLGAAALVMALLPVAWGAMRAGTLDAPVVGRAAALALAVPPRASAGERAELGTAAVEAALAELTPGGTDLVVLPEMVLPLDPTSAAGAPLRERLASAAASVGAPLLAGTLGVEREAEYNSALLLLPVRGEPVGAPFRADKRRLVPGVERASAVRAPWLAPRATGYARGDGWPVARVADADGALAFGALICYEVAFAEDARRLVRGGARALAALTSDAWFDVSFGEGGGRRAGIAQQTAHLTLRVVETRTGAVRASNGGPALVLAPTGTIAAATDAGLASAEIRAAARPTLFVRTGDLVGPSALALLLALLLLA